MPSEWSVRGFLFPIAAGLLAGSAVTAVMMPLSALCAVKLEMALSSYPMLVWVPVCMGGFAAGGFGSGFAGQRKMLCGAVAAVLLWGMSLLLLRSPGMGELLRGGVLLLTGAVGAGLVSGKRTKYKPGKARSRVRPRRRPL